MRIGISVNSSYPNVDARTGAQQMIERVRAANTAGLDSLFVGDHHNTGSNYFQNTPMLGRLLAEWQGPTAGALFLLPLWHPVLLAEQVGTLAAMHPGKFVLQCGIGMGYKQFSALGANLKNRPSAFEESIQALRQLWQGDIVSQDHRFLFSKAQVAPLPPEPIDIWIGASAPVAIQRAGKLGDGWLGAPSLTPDAARHQIAQYKAACESRTGTSAIRRDIYVAENQADATRFKALCRGYRGFEPEALVIGTTEQVSEMFIALENMGYSDVIVRSIAEDQQQAIDSIARLATVVKQV
jgi:alkanesulfonate monooxygenase SsuD/methylene tetrahydromethanopterin reductase-like flavin-dependent oxidoreductase (luciferase family)